MIELSQNRSFHFLISSAAITNLGDGISKLAFPWLATLLTRDPLLIGFVAFAGTVPWFLFSLPAGVLTDWYDRKALMIRADLLRLVLTLGVIALIGLAPVLPLASGGTHLVLVLAGLSFLLGCAEVVRDNAAQTVLPAVVSPEQLERANGQLWSIEHVMGQFVGPPLAGLLVAWAVPAPFAVDALSFGLAACLVWAMAVPKRDAPVRRRISVELSEAWHWMRDHPVILRLAVMVGLMNLFHLLSMTALVLIVQERYALPAVGYGLLMAAGSAGGVLAGLYGPRFVSGFGGQRSLMWILGLMPVPFFVIGWTHSPVLAGVALLVESGLAVTWNVVTVSYRQRRIPDALLGRVNSLYRFLAWGIMPGGALLSGVIINWAEPSLGRVASLGLPFFVAGAGSVLLALYGWKRLRL